MPIFRRKPTTISAVQFTGVPAEDPPGVFRRPEDSAPYVVTIHDQPCFLSAGDWIVPEPDGVHYYPIKDEVFRKSYEEVPAPLTASADASPHAVRIARDLYATYCASSGGLNYQGLPCPAWDALTDAVRGHWYTVALRLCECSGVSPHSAPVVLRPTSAVLGHLPDPAAALETWSRYSGHDPLTPEI